MQYDAAEALRESERRLALHVRRSPLAVVSLDLGGRIVEWNASAERLFGWSQEEALGKDAIPLLVALGDRAAAAEVLRAVLGRRGGERSVQRNVAKDGHVVLCDWYNTLLVDDAGKVIGVASVIDDVTERHEAEHALKRSEVRFRTLIENAPDAIVVHPLDDSRLVYANPAAALVLGYKRPSEMIGIPIEERIHAGDRALLAHRHEALSGAPGALPPQEYRLMRRDGSYVHVEVVSLIIEFDGRPHVMSFGRDLTERREMQARLLLADRMVSVGTLAAGVAHEINNPLAYVMTNLEMVSRRLDSLVDGLRALGGPAAELSEHATASVAMVKIAREGSERVRDIVRDLRTFTRAANDEKRTPVDVRGVLDVSINLAHNEIRHRARLVREYGDVGLVLANEARLGQVFLNLLINAAQALPVGGAAENVIRVVTEMDRAGNVVVEVSDTGPGIAPELRARIFDPFFTTKPSGEGTGLGLWICQGIVSALGGQITAETRRGAGATFRVVLPAEIGLEPFAGPMRSAPSVAPSLRRYRLLVIDDEPAIAQALAAALGGELDVRTAGSGREALAIIGGETEGIDGADFDVILCDLMLPDVSGMDVYERIVGSRPDIAARFVFATGGAFTESARAFLARTEATLVEKPFELPALRDVLRERARACSEPPPSSKTRR